MIFANLLRRLGIFSRRDERAISRAGYPSTRPLKQPDWGEPVDDVPGFRRCPGPCNGCPDDFAIIDGVNCPTCYGEGRVEK